MTDLDIQYPDGYDILPYTTTVSINVGDNINALRASILNMQEVLGLDINIGLFTPDATTATVADRLNRIERGIAERNLVFRELNVSDAVQVLLNQNNQPFVNLGLGAANQIAPVTIKGPLTVLSPQLAEPRTVIQTPVSIDVTTFDPEKSAHTLIKGKANTLQPILTVHDTSDSYQSNAVHVIGNMKIEGVLEAEFSIDHNKLLNIQTVPTDSTRGEVLHVTQGMYHSHRKGRYDSDRKTWIVATDTSTEDFGVISHNDLQGWGTLPTHDNSFVPDPNIQYHVTGGDLHDHSSGNGAQINHNDLKNISPKISNHVTGGDTHRHTSSGDGGQISHTDLSDIQTTGELALHVTGGDAHTHAIDQDGNPVGNGGQIDHNHLLNIDPASSAHVTGGDQHSHGPDGDGGQIDHINLANVGQLTHEEIDSRIGTFRAITTGTATFTSTAFNEVTVQHGLGTDQFNLSWCFSGDNFAPPSDVQDIGTIYVSDKTSSTFKLKRVGGAPNGPAVKAQFTTAFAGINNDILFVARSAGASGNDITVGFTLDPSLTAGEVVVVATTSGPSVDVRFNGNVSALDAINAVVTDPVASSLVDAFSNEGDGSGNIGAFIAANLTGGQDTTAFQQLTLEWIAVARN